ncbi:MAG: ankyrin repeat domain-containing protein [Thermoanaerobaculia bacterium]
MAFAVPAPVAPSHGHVGFRLAVRQGGKTKAVTLLLDLGADPAVRNRDGLTAEQIAGPSGHWKNRPDRVSGILTVCNRQTIDNSEILMVCAQQTMRVILLSIFYSE